VSRIAQGKVQLRRETLDLREVAEQAVEDIAPEVAERRHTLSVSLPEAPIWVSADSTRLRQIILNLLTNAVKYTEPGGQIGLSAEEGWAGAILRVRDTGDGIPPEMTARIFEMYAQVDRTLSRSQGGLGIGLTLVRQIAELHGGSVEASSGGVGEGSEFTVRIPLAEGPVGQNREASSTPHTPKARKLRVLVVDDNADTAENLSRLLEVSGHEVFQAHDGPSALRAAFAETLDGILLDIGLPGMNGLQVAEQIRCEERLKQVALFAISGYGHEDDRIRSLDAGFDDHLVKPVDLPRLLQALYRATSRLGETAQGSFPQRMSRQIVDSGC
jgi:CheY-like chemotaxis protein